MGVIDPFDLAEVPMSALVRGLAAPISVPVWLIVLAVAAAFAVSVVALNSDSTSSATPGAAAERSAPPLSPTTSCVDPSGRGPGHC
jgi:hypothetical protein